MDLVLAALGYLAVVVVLFHRLFVGDVLSPAANLWAESPFRELMREDWTPHLNGVQGDVWREFEPYHRYQFEAAKRDRFPLWNPHIYGGFPFHANAQSAMLSPFHWAYFVIDPKWAAGPVAGLKFWLAGFATFCFCRRVGLVPGASFVAGVAWMLSAYNVRWLQWNHSAAAAWLPVVLWATEGILQRCGLREIARAGLACTALQLSGHPGTQFHVSFLVCMYALLRAWLREGPGKTRAFAASMSVAAQVMGLLGAAAAVLPFAEQLPGSDDWEYGVHARTQQLPLEALVGAIAPDHFGRPRAGRFYQGPLNYNEAGLYIGIAPLVLALAVSLSGVFQWRRWRAELMGQVTISLLMWVVICSLLVFETPGVTTLLRQVPLFSQANNLRLVLGLQFAGAVLAGIAWTRLGQAPSWPAAAILATTACTVAIVLGVLLLLPGPEGLYSHHEGLWRLWSDPTVPAPLEHRSLRVAISFGFALMVVGWSMACGRWVARQAPRSKIELVSTSATSAFRVLTVWLIILSLADLAWVAYGFNPLVPPRVTDVELPEWLRALVPPSTEGRVVAVDDLLTPDLSMRFGFLDVRGYDFPLDRRSAKLFQRIGWGSIDTRLPGFQAASCVRPQVWSVLNKFAVRLVITETEGVGVPPPPQLPMCNVGGEIGVEFPTWQIVHRGPGRTAAYANPTAYPRAYFANHVRRVVPDSALDALVLPGHDLREQSFVEEEIAELETDGDERLVESIEFEQDAAEEMRLHTISSRAALLVLADRYDPGWRVEVDGQPARMIRANYLFRGVVVPAGDHQVRWSYRPWSVLWGGWLSAITVSLLLVLTLVPNRRKQGGPRID